MAARITHNLTVAEGDAGQRVDRYLAERLPELSRTRIQELIEAGLVLVGGKATKGARKLRGGEEIAIETRERPPMLAEAETIPLEILYEDEDVMVVNKPSGMTVHAGAGKRFRREAMRCGRELCTGLTRKRRERFWWRRMILRMRNWRKRFKSAR